MAAMSTGAGAALLPAIGTVTNWEGCSEAGGRLSVLETVARAADFDLFALSDSRVPRAARFCGRGAGGTVGAARDCRRVIILTGKQKQLMCSEESNPWMQTTKITGMCAWAKETAYA